MGFTAVSDTGPVLHLHEIKALDSLRIAKACTTHEVAAELAAKRVPCPLPARKANAEFTTLMGDKYDIALAEASCISLCKTEHISLMFTDDLAARAAANAEGLEARGTIGILLRSYREGNASKQQTLTRLRTLKRESTLFITQALIDEAVKAVQNHKRR